LKKYLSLFLMLAIALCFCAALAEGVPANPFGRPGSVSYNTPAPTLETIVTLPATATPTQEPVATPTLQPSLAPTQTPEAEITAQPSVAPAQQEGSAAVDVLYGADLTEEMIAQLDEQVRELMAHDGELLDNQEQLRNILLIGTDARPGEKKARSDTMIILTIDSRTNQIKLTSLMRDMYVHIPGVGNNRLNAAYYYGGAQLLMDTIEENFGLKMEEYAAVNLTTVVDVIDDLGGLTLTVDSKTQLRAINGVIDAYNEQFDCPRNSDLLTETGEQHMNGKQVQAYARHRKTDSDFHRTQRQREVLVKLYEKVSEKSLWELSVLAARYIGEVDTNLSLSDAMSLAPVLLNMKDAQTSELRLPADGDYESKTVSGMAVLVPNLKKCRERLSSFIGE